MNLWLKDSEKKLGMRWSWKQEAEKDACYTSKHQLCTCHCSLSSTHTTATISAQNPYGEFWSHDDSNRHQLWARSLSVFPNINQVVFLLLWAIQSKNHAMCVLGMLSIHPAKQTPRLEPSLLPHQHVLDLGCSFEFSFANEVKWKQLKPAQSLRPGHSNSLWLNRKWVD